MKDNMQVLFHIMGMAFFGGLTCGNACTNDLWKYDPVADSWQPAAPMPDSGRMGCSCFVLGDKAYILGGRTASVTIKNEVWEYDITNNIWQKRNNLPIPGSWRGTGFSIGARGYICYGIRPALDFNHAIYEYNQSSDTWSVVPGLTLGARTYIGSAVVNGKACLYGGVDSLGKTKNDFIVFDPQIPSLTTFPGIPSVPRKGAMAFCLNNKFYLATGLDTNSNRIRETWRNDVVIGMVENTRVNSITGFPNPAKEHITIVCGDCTEKEIQINISIISTGQIILSERLQLHDHQGCISLPGLSAGSYVLTFQNSSGTSIFKFITTEN
jgi:hypothetical protein